MRLLVGFGVHEPKDIARSPIGTDMLQVGDTPGLPVGLGRLEAALAGFGVFKFDDAVGFLLGSDGVFTEDEPPPFAGFGATETRDAAGSTTDARAAMVEGKPWVLAGGGIVPTGATLGAETVFVEDTPRVSGVFRAHGAADEACGADTVRDPARSGPLVDKEPPPLACFGAVKTSGVAESLVDSDELLLDDGPRLLVGLEVLDTTLGGFPGRDIEGTASLLANPVLGTRIGQGTNRSRPALSPGMAASIAPDVSPYQSCHSRMTPIRNVNGVRLPSRYGMRSGLGALRSY